MLDDRERRISETELSAQTLEFLQLLSDAMRNNNTSDLARPEWAERLRRTARALRTD